MNMRDWDHDSGIALTGLTSVQVSRAILPFRLELFSSCKWTCTCTLHVYTLHCTTHEPRECMSIYMYT